MPTRRELLIAGTKSVAGASLLALMGCSGGKPTSSATDGRASWEGKIAKLEARIPQLMAELHVPGASIAVIQAAKVVWQRGFGVRDQKSGVAVDADTIFEAQSMSKPVFAYRVMKLCEMGVLNLDAPLTSYTPDVFVKGDSRLKLITPRCVLSHTTGLPNWRSEDTPLKINFTPGEKWSYSGEGYHYLQSVVTRLEGRSDTRVCDTYELGYRVCASDFGDYMIANLLKPFGMESSGYVWTEEIGKKLASAHDETGRPFARKRATATDVARYGSAGSLLSTAADYAKFLIEVMEPKPADAHRLNASSFKEMFKAQVEVPESPIKTSWGLGWSIWHLDHGDVIAHGGDDTGFHSQAAFSPTRKSGFVILTNGENGAQLISQRLLGDLVELLV